VCADTLVRHVSVSCICVVLVITGGSSCPSRYSASVDAVPAVVMACLLSVAVLDGYAVGYMCTVYVILGDLATGATASLQQSTASSNPVLPVTKQSTVYQQLALCTC